MRVAQGLRETPDECQNPEKIRYYDLTKAVDRYADLLRYAQESSWAKITAASRMAIR
jgi:hypothetical protein